MLISRSLISTTPILDAIAVHCAHLVHRAPHVRHPPHHHVYCVHHALRVVPCAVSIVLTLSRPLHETGSCFAGAIHRRIGGNQGTREMPGSAQDVVCCLERRPTRGNPAGRLPRFVPPSSIAANDLR